MGKEKITATAEQKESLDKLRQKYMAWKKVGSKAKGNFRVPLEIKMLAHSLAESGVPCAAIAKKLGLNGQSVRLWVVAAEDLAKKGPIETPSNKAVLDKIASIYGSIENKSRPSNALRSKLGKLVEKLAAAGISAEDVSTRLTIHPNAVRSWLAASQPESSGSASTGSPAVPSLGRWARNVRPLDWIKIKVGGHELEIQWKDLSKRIPDIHQTLGNAEKPGANSSVNSGKSKELAEHFEFSFALLQDTDYEKTIEAFERAVLKAALDRHNSISDCCAAINLPRSTMDAKRRKFGIL